MKYITLTQGKHAIVDDDLFCELNKHKWYAQKGRTTWYAVRDISIGNGKLNRIRMHRAVIELSGGEVGDTADHRDGNGLNNQRSNLRPATHSQNKCNGVRRSDNTSGVKGVGYYGKKKGWRARICRNGHSTHIGYYPTKERAAEAYANAALEIHGEFARIV